MLQSTLAIRFPISEIDQQRVEIARKIIDGGSCKVHKAPRSGFSTSAVLAAVGAGRKVLFVVPTNRIIDETVHSASLGNFVKVAPNLACLKLEDSVGKDKFLSKLPLPLPDCKECGILGTCPVTEILNSDRLIMAITYRKLEALILSRSTIAQQILKRLSAAAIVLLDEAHTISLTPVVRVAALSQVKIPEGYPKLHEILAKWLELKEINNDRLRRILQEGNEGHLAKHLSEIFTNDKKLNFNQLVAAFNELRDLAIHRRELDMDSRDILTLRDIISLMGSNLIAITYMRDGNEGGVYLTSNYWISINALRKFLTEYAYRANHIYVSATQVEPDPNFFSDLSGKEVRDVIFPDLNKTDDKMTIYSDTRRLTAQNFKKELPRTINEITYLCRMHQCDQILVVAPNARKAEQIKKRLHQSLGPDKTPPVDYYRSDATLGVENDARICVAVGLAELPSNTYDHQARGNSEHDRWIDSQRLRRESVDAATWQTWSRVKDPKGEEESKVYCIGVREDRIRDAISWGPGREIEPLGVKEWELPNGIRGKTPIFRTTIKEPLPRPQVRSMKEQKQQQEGARGAWDVEGYLGGVENYDESLIISQNENNLPIINNRQNGLKLGIYNNPRDDFEVRATAACLKSLCASRFDCFAVQDSMPDKAGHYNWSKKLLQWKDKPWVLIHHIEGKRTVGLYQISSEDTVKWICFDVDDHKEENGAEKVKVEINRLLSVLSKYAIPFLLEASGSPNSYHVWVFLKPTRTRNAYEFARQIKKEAGIACEAFPKQAKLNKNSKYGNLVKAPLGINRKTGVKSQFLDPSTFEPYQDMIPIPRILCLRDVPGRERICGEPGNASNAKCKPDASKSPPARLGRSFRPCISRILASKVALEGSEGHEMRVAIAAEARNIGLTEEQAVELFMNQPDFNREKSRRHISYIYSQGYRPYKCSTLKEKCPSLVLNYCAGC